MAGKGKPIDSLTPFIIDGRSFQSKNDSDQGESNREILLKVIEEVYSTKDIEVKAQINERQQMAFAKVKLFAALFDVPELTSFINDLAIYSVSLGRQGRKEFTDIAKALNTHQEMETEESGRIARLLGRE